MKLATALCATLAINLAIEAAPPPAPASPKQDIAIATDAASRQAWAEAAAALARAQANLSESDPLLAFDQAVAAYRAGDLDQAAQAFNRARNTSDRALAASSAYNLGNTAMALASDSAASPPPGQQPDLAGQAKRYEEAITSYREAIALDPTLHEALSNAEIAWKRLAEVREQQQEQEQQQQQSGEQQDQQQEQQEQQQEQQQSGDQQQSGEQQDQQQEQQQSGDQQDQQQSGEQQEQQSQSGESSQNPLNQDRQQDVSDAGTPQESGRMTAEEARRMLQAVRDRARKRRLEQAQREATGMAPTGRDW